MVGAPQIDGVSRVDANDLDGAAAEAVRRNLSFNAQRAADIVRPSQGDVRAIAIQARGVPSFWEGSPQRTFLTLHPPALARLL